jgi:hypothetical protein
MAVISEVKCGRCDRRYSGFRARCPYCGARRNKRGKRADDTENAKAKLIIGVALLVVLIGATMVLLLTTQLDKSPEAAETPSGVTDEAPAFTDGEDIDEVVNSEPPVVEEPSPSPSIAIVIQSVAITYGGEPKEDVTVKIGESLQFRFTTVPASEDKEAVWESSDESIFAVVDGKVTGIATGKATLKCTVDGVTEECLVRVRGVS